MAPKTKARVSRNPDLIRGVGKYSRSKMYHKRGLWAIKAKNRGVFPRHEARPKPQAPAVKPPKYYPADDVKKPLIKKRKARPTKLRLESEMDLVIRTPPPPMHTCFEEEHPPMYVCFEANYTEKEHAYLIYSVELNQLQSNSPPVFDLEKIIIGVPSMGCGMFGSRIVLAGGLVRDKYGRDKKSKAIITYDINSKQLSTQDIPKMRGGKVKPLLFEMNSKLYVLDTSEHLQHRSFEIYYPNQNQWHCIRGNKCLSSPTLALSKGLGRFSWFTFGKCLCMSLPRARHAYLHHSKHNIKWFDACFNKPLQFQGMAITYCQQDDFEDVVVISYSEGLIQGHRLCLSFVVPCEKPVLLLDTKKYFEHDSEMCGFFTNFGSGNFCFAAFEKSNVTFYKFDISRTRNRSSRTRNHRKNGRLRLKASNIVVHRFSLINFAVQGHTNLTVAGCFSLLQDLQSKENTEARLYSDDLPLLEDEERDDDILDSEYAYHSYEDGDGDVDPDSDADDPEFELSLKREKYYLKLRLGLS